MGCDGNGMAKPHWNLVACAKRLCGNYFGADPTSLSQVTPLWCVAIASKGTTAARPVLRGISQGMEKIVPDLDVTPEFTQVLLYRAVKQLQCTLADLIKDILQFHPNGGWNLSIF